MIPEFSESRKGYDLPEDYLNEKAPSLFDDAISKLRENKGFVAAAAEYFLTAPHGQEASDWPGVLEFESNDTLYTLTLSIKTYEESISISYSDNESDERVGIEISYNQKKDESRGVVKEVAISHQKTIWADGATRLDINSLEAVINASNFIRRI
jgi:hypothetical protein